MRYKILSLSVLFSLLASCSATKVDPVAEKMDYERRVLQANKEREIQAARIDCLYKHKQEFQNKLSNASFSLLSQKDKEVFVSPYGTVQLVGFSRGYGTILIEDDINPKFRKTKIIPLSDIQPWGHEPNCPTL